MKQDYIQRVTLTSTFDTPREFAGTQLNLTAIQLGLYFIMAQICQLLGIDAKTVRDRIDSIYEEMSTNSRGGLITPPCYLIIYEAEVYFQPATPTSGGGGVQLQKFYHHELVIRIIERMRNTERKAALLNWMRAIVSNHIQHGYTIDDHAMIEDPTTLQSISTRLDAFNFSPERQAMVEVNKGIDYLFSRVTGTQDVNGQFIYPIWNYFRRCCHNTGHMAVLGQTALQLRAARANPNSLTFGQENFRGKFAPRNNELGNACNFLTNNELLARVYVIRAAVAKILIDIDSYGPIDFHTALKMFTMHCVSKYNPFVSWDYRDYPETALDSIINMVDTSLLRRETQLAIQTYQTNFPNRHSHTAEQALVYQEAEQHLVAESIAHVSDGELI